MGTTKKTGAAPITLIRAEEFEGGVLIDNNPLLLAYDSVHFESIEPISRRDELRAIELADWIQTGKYKLTFRDTQKMTKISQNFNPDLEAKKITIGPEMSHINKQKNKCDVCVINYQISANLTTHNRKIHKLNECEICKLQTYGDNACNDHKKICKNKRNIIRMENDKKDREIKKINANYKNAFTMLMDETTAKIEKITESEKQNNIEKEKRKIAGAELKKYKETKLNKNLKVEIQIVRTTAQRRRMMEAYRKLMIKVIDNSVLKKKDELEFIKLCQDQINHVATKSTLLDWYNKVIMLLRGESVLTWYTPCDKSKDKEPWLDLRLTDKWLPKRTSVQKELLKDERQKGAIKILGEDPIEREKRRKQLNQEKIMRVIKNVPVKIYTCNARNANEKMEVVASDGQKFKTDVIHLGEAGVGPNKARDLSGYTTLELARSGPNRGSVMYVKKYLYEKSVRIYDKEGEEENKGAEIIQLLISSVQKTSIYGVYLETGKSNEEKAHAHQRLTGR